MDSDCFQELTLRSPSFVAVLLSVEDRASFGFSNDARFPAPSEPLTILNMHSSRFRSWSEIVRHKYGRGQRDATARLEGRKDKVRILLVRRLAAPLLQMIAAERIYSEHPSQRTDQVRHHVNCFL
jgi:hypothetical protein